MMHIIGRGFILEHEMGLNLEHEKGCTIYIYIYTCTFRNVCCSVKYPHEKCLLQVMPLIAWQGRLLNVSSIRCDTGCAHKRKVSHGESILQICVKFFAQTSTLWRININVPKGIRKGVSCLGMLDGTVQIKANSRKEDHRSKYKLHVRV